MIIQYGLNYRLHGLDSHGTVEPVRVFVFRIIKVLTIEDWSVFKTKRNAFNIGHQLFDSYGQWNQRESPFTKRLYRPGCGLESA